MVKNRHWYLDYLRIIACFSVVLMHSCSSAWFRGDVRSFDWQFVNCFRTAYSVPVFFMISGVLFLNPDRQISIKKIYTGNIFKMILLYMVWTIIYAIFSGNHTLSAIYNFTMDPTHYTWFLMAMAGCYMMIPILQKIADSPTVVKYFLLLFLLHNLRGDIHTLLSAIPSRLFTLPNQWLINAFSMLNIDTIVGYPGLFLLGYFLNSTLIKKPIRIMIYIAGIISFISAVCITSYVSVHNGTPTGTRFIDNFSTLTTIQASAIFLFGKHALSKLVPKGNWESKVVNFSKITLGIYLIHMILFDLLYHKFNIDAFFITPLIAVPVLFLTVFTLSALISWLLNKIPIIRKYLV